MSQGPLEINQLIELEVGTGEQRETHRSRIEEIGERTLLVAAPMRHGVPVYLAGGTEVYVRFVRDRGLFSFAARVVGSRGGTLPMLELTRPVRIARTERRAWVRMATVLQCRCRRLDAASDSGDMEATTINLGGGGALLTAPAPLEPGTPVRLTMRLPDEVPVEADGEVLRCEAAGAGGRRYWHLAVRFVDIQEKVREHLIRFVFQRQRELIRRGMLR
ncbi:MAG: flagellar brake protein [Syntrophomonadaceae bacterium]|jgi:c-di-GMP-binding flagellar brake protein YcgR|nr:flagellar brake protein [Syntrophomonadaceae bacterium]MDH7497294.1 flagellar brake protein [Syntrophomonadaceae bacterium]